ncbi:MAG: hemolysin family protein [Chloroflexota bacterium]|nr:hemolysin family protein [Chloroflexota bacterium]
MWFEVLLILVLVLGNGILAMSETAIVSARQARLQQRAERGEGGARIALNLTRNPNIFLATVQIGISLIGVLSGAFGGATAARSLAALIANVEPLSPYASQIGLVIVVLVITYLSLIIGELVPKRIALNDPEAIAARVAGPMSTIAAVGSPLVRLLSSSTDAVLRLLGVQQQDDPPITAEEIGVLLEQGARAGVFEPAEQEMVEAVFDLSNEPVAAHMTPRPSVVWIDLDDPDDLQRQTLRDARHTRIPLCRGNLDHVVGVVQAKDLLNLYLTGSPFEVERSAHPALFVPETMSALQLLEQFRRSREQIALVIDEFGGVAGLVSLQDVLEAIVGDIPSATGQADAAMVARPDGSWLIDGAISFDEAADRLNFDDLPDSRGGFHTLAGFVLAAIGHIPVTGERFSASGWAFEVIDMDGHRVDKVLATPIAAETTPDSTSSGE